jgi:LysR family transcriptional regulator, regulator for metE and metH
MAPDHRLAARDWIEPADLRRETLITYPVERKRLDIFTRFLDPAGIGPKAMGKQAKMIKSKAEGQGGIGTSGLCLAG